MDEQEFRFRTAAFGGFLKQDVMDYLEKSAREHKEKLSALQQELSETRSAWAGEKAQGAALEQRTTALEEENRRLAADLADREDRLNQAMAERDELKRLSQSLQEKVDRLEPEAAAYAAVKDRTATIELEAHGRAQVIEREGRAKAAKCQEQVKEWFAQTRAAYDRLRGDLEALLNHTAQTLSQAGQGLEGIEEGLKGREDALNAIQAQIEALDGPKPPQPLA